MGSYGQTLLKELLGEMLKGTPLEDHRPDWLFGMELDLFYPEHSLAFEFQGDQHFIDVYGMDNLKAQKSRDSQKRMICVRRGIVLVKVEACDLTANGVFKKLRTFIFMQRKPAGWTMTKSEIWKKILRGSKKKVRHCAPELSAAGEKYCSVLRRNYQSPTAIPRGNLLRKKIIRERGESNPYWRPYSEPPPNRTSVSSQ
jgi:hypothetical protein